MAEPYSESGTTSPTMTKHIVMLVVATSRLQAGYKLTMLMRARAPCTQHDHCTGCDGGDDGNVGSGGAGGASARHVRALSTPVNTPASARISLAHSHRSLGEDVGGHAREVWMVSAEEEPVQAVEYEVEMVATRLRP